MKKNKKAVISLYITFIISFILIVLIASVLAPMGVMINTKFYEAGETILRQTNSSMQIQDAEVAAALQADINAALDAQQNNIEVNANIVQYSWILVVAITAIILFLYSRRLVEVGAGGFV